MNKPLRRIAIFCGVLILALIVRTNWLQYGQADELNAKKQNLRIGIERYAHERGNIIVDGNPITGSVVSDSTYYKYKRTWKDGPMWAPVTGYSSQVFDATQLEKLNDSILTGNDDRLFFDRTLSMFTGTKKQGGNVVTTLNADAQKAAFKGLGDKKGAAVALDPKTGAILALASTPSYDPSSFAGNTDTDSKNYKKLLDDKSQPMLNRALRQTYPPGSAFKVVTAAAALENGLYSNIDSPTDSPLPWKLPLSTQDLPNEGPLPCKNASLRLALQVSCNTVFGKIGADLGEDKMRAEAEKFGFNSEQFTPTRAYASVFSKNMDGAQTALSSIGQFNTAATPLQMAMVASAVANDGTLMKPYMVDRLTAPNLDTVAKTEPQKMSEPMSKEHAQMIQQMMETVVEKGTGTMAKIPGATVGGKTGTAQNGINNSGNPYAWFISYAKTAQGSPVAVAVVVEDSNATREHISGGGLAAPIAKAMMQAVINSEK
ncbi:penicillin-binding transpeptidase domain-containing protein [Streptomyces sp. NBC_01387]|uniref:peptidoglycan D,D-transpeptidase FtsI family protein n=1 Tax=unclassified Streptomyces TaxID=2593676 RepID=UPI0020242939|nr:MULTISPECIES: penicillin-binding transpeptidase domain-containing protein [unclassified Streptomyces]MCX4549654.1 penicillin-binding transpeptidase domain-containing protein [Streptomyces sp. NBC_01500]WSC21183.1 penicillin-binding transpeptidase domain-containing protein [Streptomyces sp. NBC_01766]WSV55119.1 penicillin-binding transpeptidase domain-containing protein [Streptomyces sp. NBC_01014]